MKILWDEAKNAANRKKHGVSFEQAKVLLADDSHRLEIYDDEHSTAEDRFFAIGPAGGEMLVVVYAEPREGVLRIISARRATRRESRLYRTGLQQ